MVSMMKSLGLNLTTLPQETLYQLQDGITIKMRTRESRMIQVLSEQKINIEHLSLQRDELVSQKNSWCR